MRSLRSAAPLLGVGVVLVLAGPASAADRVAALVPQIRPPAAPEVRDRFHEAVTRGLQTGPGEVVPAGEVRLQLGASDEMLNCAGGGGCVARAAQALRADHLVATEVDATGKDYTIEMRLLDPVGRELAKVDEPCDICTVREVEDAIARAAGKLAAATRALPSETTPPAPETLPPTATTPPTPTPKPEPTPPPKAEPPPTPSPASETPAAAAPVRKGFPWRPVAISSLAVGLVGVVVGIPLLAIDGQPTCNKPDPKQSCPEVYNTVGGGATLLTFGLAGVAASGVLFYLDHRARKRAHPTVSVMPLRGGAFVSAGGRF
jgi:hypothetical protein